MNIARDPIDRARTAINLLRSRVYLSPEDLYNLTVAFEIWNLAFETDTNNVVRIVNLTVNDEQHPGRLKRSYYFFSWARKDDNTPWFIDDLHDFDRILEPELITTIMPNLQRLSINFFKGDRAPDVLLIQSISHLSRLQHLEIRKLRQNKENLEIVHPTLTYLEIDEYEPSTAISSGIPDHLKLHLVTPELIGFKTKTNVEYFDFTRANRICRLSVKLFQHEILEIFARFNLTHFWCKRLRNLEPELISSASDILCKFRRLEELHFRDRMPEEIAESILFWKQRLSKLPNPVDFKFYYGGIRIDTIRELPSFVEDGSLIDLTTAHANFDLVLINYLRLARQLPFNGFVQYNKLEQFSNDLISMQLPLRAHAAFFDQWVDIRDLHIERLPIHRQNFIAFMRNYKNLSRLTISYLDREMCEQLPELFPNLKSLVLNQPIVLNFIWNFNPVNMLSIIFRFPPGHQMVARAFESFPHLQMLSFPEEAVTIGVSLLVNGDYQIRMLDVGLSMEMDRKNLIEFFENSRDLVFANLP